MVSVWRLAIPPPAALPDQLPGGRLGQRDRQHAVARRARGRRAAQAAGPLFTTDGVEPQPYRWDTSNGPIPVWTDGGGAFTWDYDGVQYYKVENDLKFEYYTLYFEVETGMLTRIGNHWWLEGYRPIDGVLVPATVVQGRKGGSTNLYFDTVSHGTEVKPYLCKGGNIVDE